MSRPDGVHVGVRLPRDGSAEGCGTKSAVTMARDYARRERALYARARIPGRTAQLNAYARAHGLDIETVAIRGNVDTRIRYVHDGELDAVVLAAAGLSRIGRIDEVTDFLSIDTVLPAPGQGALAIECVARIAIAVP